MKLTYTKKATFNINGTTIHLGLAIPLNKNYNDLKPLSDEKCDILIKAYDQLQLVVIDEVFLVDNRMLSFIDCKLRVIKQIHTEFMGGFVIMIGDFYQALLI
jgi:hypothetical protein